MGRSFSYKDPEATVRRPRDIPKAGRHAETVAYNMFTRMLGARRHAWAKSSFTGNAADQP